MRFLLVFCVLFFPFSTRAQFDKECRQLFYTAVEKFKTDLGSVDEGVLEYEITTRLAGQREERTESVKVTYKGTKSKIETPQIKVFQDDASMVTVIRDRKAIYFSETTLKKQWKKDRLQALGILQDTLMQYLVFNSCETTCPDPSTRKFEEKIEMSFGKPFVGFNGIKKITYWIERSALNISKVQIDYLDGTASGVQSLQLKIVRIEQRVTGTVFQGSAGSQVRNGNGSLKPAYKGFEVIGYKQ